MEPVELEAEVDPYAETWDWWTRLAVTVGLIGASTIGVGLLAFAATR